jgi:2'-5' RNA ligase
VNDTDEVEFEHAPTSALIVEVPEAEPYVAGYRNEHDPTTRWGVPAHITLLFPFLPPDLITAEHHHLLRATVSKMQSFTIELATVDEFPGVLWLDPLPAHHLIRLTHALWEAFPETPPYGGQHDRIHPHLTVAMTADEEAHDFLREQIRYELAPHLPIVVPVTSITLSVTGENNEWQRAAVFPLGQ